MSLLDRVIFVPAQDGAGDFNESSAVPGYQTMEAAGAVDGQTYSYAAQTTTPAGAITAWEVGQGTWTAATRALSRTTVLFSSTGSKISFTSPPQVMICALAEDLQSGINFPTTLNFQHNGTTVGDYGITSPNPTNWTFDINATTAPGAFSLITQGSEFGELYISGNSKFGANLELDNKNGDDWGIATGSSTFGTNGKFTFTNLTPTIPYSPMSFLTSNSYITIGSTLVAGFVSVGDSNVGAIDTGISRLSANNFAFGNGTQGDISAQINCGYTLVQSTGGGAILELLDTGSTDDWAIFGGGLTNRGWLSIVNFTNGRVPFAVNSSPQSVNLGSATSLNWSNATDANAGSTDIDTGISRTAAASVAVGNGAQGDASGTLWAQILRTGATTVASLPAAGTNGRRTFVTDSGVVTFASTPTSGGTNGVPVYDDGSKWRVG